MGLQYKSNQLTKKYQVCECGGDGWGGVRGHCDGLKISMNKESQGSANGSKCVK